MTNTIDPRTAIAESDILSALDGIVNSHLLDGIADSSGDVHQVRVVTWCHMGQADRYAVPGLTSLSVIVHLDGQSIAPFGGSYITVALDTLSHAATLVATRAMAKASEELDRREEAIAELDAQDNTALGSDSLDSFESAIATSNLNEAIHELAVEVMAEVRTQTQRGYEAAYTAFCLGRNVVEGHPLSRRQFRAYLKAQGLAPVPEFVKLGQGVSA